MTELAAIDKFGDMQTTTVGNEPTRSFYDRMGQILGKRIESEIDVIKLVGQGLPASAVAHFLKEVDVELGWIGAETTIRRRLQTQQKFSTDESERLVRFARITSMAEEMFGNTESATAWLSTRAHFIPDAEAISPLELSATDPGARLVESMMLQTAHGIF